MSNSQHSWVLQIVPQKIQFCCLSLKELCDSSTTIWYLRMCTSTFFLWKSSPSSWLHVMCMDGLFFFLCLKLLNRNFCHEKVQSKFDFPSCAIHCGTKHLNLMFPENNLKIMHKESCLGCSTKTTFFNFFSLNKHKLSWKA